MTDTEVKKDRDGVQLPPVSDASNYIPVMDDGTNYRPSANNLTSHLGGDQDYDKEDTTVYKAQGYVPPSDRDGQLFEDKPLTAKKIAQELAAANINKVLPQIVKPVSEVAKAMKENDPGTDPVEYPSASVAATAVGQPREPDDKAKATEPVVKQSSPVSAPTTSAKTEAKA